MDKGGLPYEFERTSEYSLLVLKPAMNNAQWSDIERIGDDVLRDLESTQTPHLIVDLSEMDYIGSAMVALLVRFWKIVKSKKARMLVVIRDPMVLEVLKIAKLDQVWDIVEYREDALYELGVSPEAKSERRESNVLVMASLFAALVGAIVLGTYLARPDWAAVRLTQILAFGCSGLGIVLGGILIAKSTGNRRLLGVLSACVSVAVFAGAIWKIPLMAEQPAPAENASTENPRQDSQTPQGAAESGSTENAPDPQTDPDAESEPAAPAVAEKPKPPTEE